MNSNKLDSKYKLLIQLGSGSFGSVWRILNKTNRNEYAIKIETKNSKSRLKNEFKIYRNLMLCGVQGIPIIKDYFETNKNCYLVMQLLGKSLDQILNSTENPFDITTVLKIGIYIIRLLESIHNAGYLHRDIKPNNFLTGKEDVNNLYIMDFGLSKKYILDNGEHIAPREERSLIGTARYASINVHMGYEPSRRDDLESVGYMLIYFLKKKLPWQGLKKVKNVDQVKIIGECKMKTSLQDLCCNLPECFKQYLEYCRKLQFSEKPNYDYLVNLFLQTSEKLKLNLKFFWT